MASEFDKLISKTEKNSKKGNKEELLIKELTKNEEKKERKERKEKINLNLPEQSAEQEKLKENQYNLQRSKLIRKVKLYKRNFKNLFETKIGPYDDRQINSFTNDRLEQIIDDLKFELQCQNIEVNAKISIQMVVKLIESSLMLPAVQKIHKRNFNGASSELFIKMETDEKVKSAVLNFIVEYNEFFMTSPLSALLFSLTTIFNEVSEKNAKLGIPPTVPDNSNAQQQMNQEQFLRNLIQQRLEAEKLKFQQQQQQDQQNKKENLNLNEHIKKNNKK